MRHECRMDSLREKGLAPATNVQPQASEGGSNSISHGNGRWGPWSNLNRIDFSRPSDVSGNWLHESNCRSQPSPEFILESDIPTAVIERETKIATVKAKEDVNPDASFPRSKKARSKIEGLNCADYSAYIRDESITCRSDQSKDPALEKHHCPPIQPLALAKPQPKLQKNINTDNR